MFLILLSLFERSLFKVAHNDLRANEGRETNALNCKPITNLKEKYELSNLLQTSGFLLHAVIGRFSLSVKHLHSPLDRDTVLLSNLFLG